jgi:hypothetical protein
VILNLNPALKGTASIRIDLLSLVSLTPSLIMSSNRSVYKLFRSVSQREHETHEAEEAFSD